MSQTFGIRHLLFLVMLIGICLGWYREHAICSARISALSARVRMLETREAAHLQNPDDRRASLKNLSASNEKEATVALLYALTDPDIACRKIAIEALKNRPELSNLNLDRLVQLAENQEQLEIE